MPKELTEEQQNAIARASLTIAKYRKLQTSMREAMQLLKERHPDNSIVYNRLDDIRVQLGDVKDDAEQKLDELLVSWGVEPFYAKKPAEKIPAYRLRA